MLAKSITYMDQPCILVCDACCRKAWGRNSRPSRGDEWLADDELPDAPVDPGTVEYTDSKPTVPAERLNRWCARECERAALISDGEDFNLRDWSMRQSK